MYKLKKYKIVILKRCEIKITKNYRNNYTKMLNTKNQHFKKIFANLFIPL